MTCIEHGGLCESIFLGFLQSRYIISYGFTIYFCVIVIIYELTGVVWYREYYFHLETKECIYQLFN